MPGGVAARNGTGFPLKVPSVPGRCPREPMFWAVRWSPGDMLARSFGRTYPEMVMVLEGRTPDSAAMQVISLRRGQRRGRTTTTRIMLGGVVGAVLLVCGIGLAWLAFATPLLRTFEMPVRPTAGQMALGATAWAIALTGPAACVVLGIARLAGTTERLAGLRPRVGAVSSLAEQLGADYVVAVDVQLPDGRRVPEVVIGAHGVALFEPAPPPAISRHSGGRWEARVQNGRWVPMESPLDRAGRDAERLRRWFAADDRDFVVKVHAALITTDDDLPRSPQCAVITRDQIGPWLASLPPQRSLTPSRRDRLVGLVRESI
jgi:hypothetical protein